MDLDTQEHANISGKRSGFDRRVFSDPNYRGVERRISGERRTRKDKRANSRFRVKDLTFVKLQSESKVDIGQLLDISKQGLALRCFVDEEKPREYSSLGIFLSGGEFIVDDVPFRTVSDIELNNNPQFSTIILRRYGLQFKDLTPEQVEKLDKFLLNHALGRA